MIKNRDEISEFNEPSNFPGDISAGKNLGQNKKSAQGK
jgi:hypothetical protein